MSKVHLFSVLRGTSDRDVIQKVRLLARDAFDDFSWLNANELVWLKPALNSCDEHPAITDWRVIQGLAELIKARGGRVALADQSGIEYDKEGSATTSPSEYCYAKSGMSRCGQEFRALEKEDFWLYEDMRAEHWPSGFHVPDLLKEADHIINLPRISTHGQAGVTLGAKNWVGALQREDRYLFHREFPLYWYIQTVKMGSGEHLPSGSCKRGGFNMIAELLLSFRAKLRGTMFLATKVQTTMGPNKHLMEPAGIGMFRSYVLVPNPGLIIASSDPVAADAAALAWLFDCYEQTPWHAKFLEKILVLANGRIKELGTYDVFDNPMIARQLELGLGKKPTLITGHNIPDHVLKSIEMRLGIKHGML